jgi:hypothetical protein
MCSPRVTRHISNISSCQKKSFHFSSGCEKFHEGTSFGFLVINVCNHGEHYETPCRLCNKLTRVMYTADTRSSNKTRYELSTSVISGLKTCHVPKVILNYGIIKR